MGARMPARILLDDLISAGYMGLISAATRYSPALGGTFASYARYRIRGAILDWAQDKSTARSKQCGPCQGHGLIERQECTNCAGSGRVWPQFVEALNDLDEDGQTIGHVVADPNPGVEASAEASEHREIVSKALRYLTPRDRALLQVLYLDEGGGMAAAMELFDVTSSRISQMHKEAMTRARAELQRAGFTNIRDIVAS